MLIQEQTGPEKTELPENAFSFFLLEGDEGHGLQIKHSVTLISGRI